MPTIEDIRLADDELFEIIKYPLSRLVEELNSFEHGKTFSCLLMFHTKAAFLKNAIFDLSESSDIYSSKVLYRTLMEIFLKFNYIFFRYASEKSDDAAQEYQLFADLAEDIDYGRAWIFVDQLRSVDGEKKSLRDLLSEIKPEFQKYSEKEIKEIVKQFRIKNLIRFITNTLNSGDSRFVGMLSWIPEYSELSSFVHGGPFADKFILSHFDDAKREKELIHICQMTYFIFSNIAELLFMILSNIDEIYKLGFIKIHKHNSLLTQIMNDET